MPLGPLAALRWRADAPVPHKGSATVKPHVIYVYRLQLEATCHETGIRHC